MGGEKSLAAAGRDAHADGGHIAQRIGVIVYLPGLTVLFLHRCAILPGGFQPSYAQRAKERIQRYQSLLLITLELEHGQRALMS